MDVFTLACLVYERVKVVGMCAETFSYVQMHRHRRDNPWGRASLYGMTAALALSLIGGCVYSTYVYWISSRIDTSHWARQIPVEVLFELLPYRSTITLCATCMEVYTSLPLIVVYVQVFRGVVSPKAFRFMTRLVKVSSCALTLAALCVYAWDTLVYRDMYRGGLDRFTLDMFYGHTDLVWAVYVGILGTLCLALMAFVVASIALLRRMTTRTLQARSMGVSGVKRRRSLNKMAILPWLYTVIVVCTAGITVLALVGALASQMWLLDVGTVLQYTCMSLVYYPLRPSKAKKRGVTTSV
ncbi:hypothetical protein KIPB_003039 [Kipferlia bialata]|uniref:Uncharacterized protein n=1 Tax=Kipferlia bialata TaxID=797122 RepID=A0A9K3CTC1_9EUKA|nr:hypothetical protein KIPB_003039 [Kipferlia bialata]|eukprot:g3039.t1